MNMKETAAIMGKVKLGDNRNFGSTREEKATYLNDWHDNIGDLNFQDAWDAVVMHRKESADYLQVAHIRANAKRAKLRREREARINTPRAITGNVITLDKAEFDRLTQESIAHHRALKAGGS